jgi:nitrogen fixation protein FixH
MTRELTGRHVLAIAICAFAVIIAANLTMLFSATGSFPGLVVKNSYVASQGWNGRVEAQEALGWSAAVRHADGKLAVELTGPDGAPVRGVALSAIVGRPTTNTEDRVLTLTGTLGTYIVPVTLASGAWRIEITTTEGPAFTKTATLFVSGAD